MLENITTNNQTDSLANKFERFDADNSLHGLVNHVTQEYLDTTQNYPWVVAFSGGKDSTLIAHVVFEALMGIPPSLRCRSVYFVSNDTLVESPLVVSHMKAVLKQIQNAADILALPIKTAVTTPSKDQTFWVLLIGKGYPSPNRSMRWCTDRLKIQPTSQFILSKVQNEGAAIIVLGVRKDESNNRRNSINAHKNLENSNLTPHNSLPGAFVFRPIVDLSTDEVWEMLASNAPPWGGKHQQLIQLYRDAAGGECPIVLSQEEAPGCGTNSSRFGCWTCTVVDKDKSLQGFVDVGKIQFQPLLEFRDWLVSIRNDSQYRQTERRNGQIQYNNGKHILGPFTIQARKMILDRLLAVEKEYGEKLITDDEVETIRAIWTDDIIAHEERHYA